MGTITIGLFVLGIVFLIFGKLIRRSEGVVGKQWPCIRPGCKVPVTSLDGRTVVHITGEYWRDTPTRHPACPDTSR